MSAKDRPTYNGINIPIKRSVGETLEENMTQNAYQNILSARYLHKDENGNFLETQEELFARVAKNVALAEVVYSSHNPEEGVEVTPEHIKTTVTDSKRAELIEEVFGEGVTENDDVTTTLSELNINKFSYDSVLPLISDKHRAEVESVRDEFEEMMTQLSFTPNSPTLMNAGLELQQLSACFVMSPEDNIEDIHDTAKDAALVFQSGGGCGYGFWNLRPYGDPVGSTGGIASGPITFMRTFDQLCETIAQGGKRRGAQMSVFRVSHPDVIEFIHSKNKDVSLAVTLKLNDPDDFTHTTFGAALDEARELIDEEGRVPSHLRNAVEGHLSNFNISVGITDDFMDALYNDENFTFENPHTGEAHIATPETKEMYERYDLGEYVTVGEPLEIPANLIWERIIDGAYENGEPGIIYLERVNKDHSFDVSKPENSKYKILATNPCGEQPLMEYEACNLGHINLSTLAAFDAPDWRHWSSEHESEYSDHEAMISDYLMEALDMEEFNYRIDYGTRFLENVVTMSDFPIDRIERCVRENRKIGLGIMGLAQLFIQLGFQYGADDANEFTRQLMRHINHRSKWASNDIAKQRGPFANWADSKYATPTEYREWFERQTGLDADEYEDGFALRNHNTTTIAPTGTTSMIANTSGGCEPIFSVAYFKNVSDDVQGDEMLVEFDDYFLRVLDANDIDVEQVKEEAVELMQTNQFDGVNSIPSVPQEIGELFVVTADLSGIEHASVQCACQEGVDSAISKTCNFPNDANREDMDEVFRYIYDHGGKGVTVYRDGSRSKQVLTTRAKNAEFADDEEAAEYLIEQIHDVFGGLEGFLENDDVRDELGSELQSLLEADTAPQAAQKSTPQYAEKRERPEALYGVTQRINTGYGRIYVNINEDENGEPFELFANIGNSGGFTASFTEALAKTVSVALRSGVDPLEVAGELRGIRSPKVGWDRSTQINSIPDAIGTAMFRYMEGDIAQRPSGAPDEEQTKAVAAVRKEQEQKSALLDEGHAGCPECGKDTLNFSEGCKTCESCGWSEC